MRSTIMTLVVAGVLAACGGGGGDSGGTPQSALSANNVDSFTGPLARLVLTANGSGLEGVVAADRESVTASTIRRWAARGAREQAMAVTVTIDCSGGGSATVTADDIDRNAQLNAGDTMTIGFAGCIEAGEPPLNGTLSTTFTAIQLDPFGEPVSFSLSGTFGDLRSGNLSQLNGPFAMAYNGQNPDRETLLVTYFNVTSTLLGETLIYNFAVDVAITPVGDTFEMNGSVGINGTTLTILQEQPFILPPAADAPTAGTLSAHDAAGNELLLRAKPADRVDFEFTPAGTNAPTVQRIDLAWDSFRRG